MPYSASASTQPKRAPEAITRSTSSSAILHFGRHTAASGTPARAEPLRIAGPALGQEQAQADADRHLGAGQCERDQNLAVGPFAELAAVLPLHPDRVLALLHQRGVVDNQHRVRSADQALAAFTSSSSRGAVAQGEAETK